MPDDEGDETSLVSAKDSKWKFRPPPRGVAKEALKLCQEVGEGSTGVCEMQENCVQAHSLEELEEWGERWGEGHKTNKKKEGEEGKETYSDKILAEVLQAKGNR